MRFVYVVLVGPAATSTTRIGTLKDYLNVQHLLGHATSGPNYSPTHVDALVLSLRSVGLQASLAANGARCADSAWLAKRAAEFSPSL